MKSVGEIQKQKHKQIKQGARVSTSSKPDFRSETVSMKSVGEIQKPKHKQIKQGAWVSASSQPDFRSETYLDATFGLQKYSETPQIRSPTGYKNQGVLNNKMTY